MPEFNNMKVKKKTMNRKKVVKDIDSLTKKTNRSMSDYAKMEQMSKSKKK